MADEAPPEPVEASPDAAPSAEANLAPAVSERLASEVTEGDAGAAGGAEAAPAGEPQQDSDSASKDQAGSRPPTAGREEKAAEDAGGEERRAKAPVTSRTEAPGDEATAAEEASVPPESEHVPAATSRPPSAGMAAAVDDDEEAADSRPATGEQGGLEWLHRAVASLPEIDGLMDDFAEEDADWSADSGGGQGTGGGGEGGVRRSMMMDDGGLMGDGFSDAGVSEYGAAVPTNAAALKQHIAEAAETRDMLMSVHVGLSRRLSSVVSARPHTTVADDFVAEASEPRYVEALQQWRGLLQETQRLAEQYHGLVSETRERADTAQTKSAAAAEQLHALLHETARNCVYSSNKGLPDRVFKERLGAFQQKGAEVAQARLRHIRLKGRALALKNTLKEQEQLSEGLHLIDFEKQKADNAMLSSKAADREGECQRLRGKTATALQVLAHMKEKVSFLRKEVVSESAKLESTNGEAAEVKERLRRLKRELEGFRSGADAMRSEHGTITQPVLLADYDQHAERHAALSARLQALRGRYHGLTAEAAMSVNTARQSTRLSHAGGAMMMGAGGVASRRQSTAAAALGAEGSQQLV